jgi:hypothetical protein
MDEEQGISFPLQVVYDAFTDYSDNEDWREFRDLLIMRFNAYTRKRDEISQAGLRRQEEQEQKVVYQGG